MTAAAGFEFDGGLLFCADTKIETNIKTREPKLFTNIYGASECATVFAVAAEDFQVAKAAVRDCEEAIGKVKFEEANIASIRDTIQSTLARFYATHIFPTPDPQTIEFQFLIGIWLRGETRMYSSQGTVLNRVNGYECVGSGAYLSKYLIKQFGLKGRPMLDEVGLIAAYALDSAMKHDEYVGGEIEFIIMQNNGEFGQYHGAPVYPSDSFPTNLQRLMWGMLRQLIRITDRNKFQCEMAIEDFCTAVHKLNESERKLFDFAQRSASETSEPEQ